jgi:hypothetical protein
VDFTSAPGRRKPIVVAHGTLLGDELRLAHIETLEDWQAFEAFIARPGPWLGAFDFPFGLPREAVSDLGWPRAWEDMVRHCVSLGRSGFRAALDAYRESRPAGRRYAHRATDQPARSHSPLKLVNPPVALMFLEGASRLLDAGLHLPGLFDGDRRRIAVEAYPGYLARSIEPASYKGDAAAARTPARHAARARIVTALVEGRHPLGMRLVADEALAASLLADHRGDRLDATLAMVQAGACARAGAPGFGLPPGIDSLEGWIATVPSGG